MGNSLTQSARYEGKRGAVAWAMLELFRRTGVDPEAVHFFEDQVVTCIERSSDEDISDIFEVLERRLASERTLD